MQLGKLLLSERSKMSEAFWRPAWFMIRAWEGKMRLCNQCHSWLPLLSPETTFSELKACTESWMNHCSHQVPWVDASESRSNFYPYFHFYIFLNTDPIFLLMKLILLFNNEGKKKKIEVWDCTYPFLHSTPSLTSPHLPARKPGVIAKHQTSPRTQVLHEGMFS